MEININSHKIPWGRSVEDNQHHIENQWGYHIHGRLVRIYAQCHAAQSIWVVFCNKGGDYHP